jgi:signal transduction histidine kinase
MFVTKLLVIDDELPFLEVLEMSLASEGYDVITAKNGEEGLTVFERQNPKLVLTDIKMPGIDGIEVLRRIKSIDSQTEVIVITGHGDLDSAIAALQHGASDFITKPVRGDILKLALDRAEAKIAISRQLADYTENLEEKVEACTLELRQAQEELIRRERLATIGETVAGVAHYIKNILSGLRGGLYMVDTGFAAGKTQMFQEGSSMVGRNIERISVLALDLLRYAKERQPERTACRPNEIVAEAVGLFREKAKEHGVKLDAILDPNLKEGYLDYEGIYRVLVNLISNAIDACVYDEDTSKAWEVKVKSKLETDTDSKENIVFEISDNGCGMTDEVKAKLFTKFFSTKAGRGTGLGLLITQKIVQEHDGDISVESEVGQGTTFFVRLRQATQEGKSGPSEANL